jgi:bifunctional non-homologous end joining protein LigD
VALELYRRKRKFDVTVEPRGRKAPRGGDRYVIQKHAARRLHYDLRLELDGVMKSWAVARGPSLDPAEKRLAVHVEDHPIEYNSFEGTIPQGEYGGGTVMIWDRGRWFPESDPHRGYAKGHLDFVLDGEKLRGRWHLVRMRSRDGDRHENWLLIKGKDEEARSGRSRDILDEEPFSAATGRSIDEIAAGKGKKRVWHSRRDADNASADFRPQTQREFKAQLRALANSQGKKNSKPQAKVTSTAKSEPKPPPWPAARRKSRAKPAATAAARKRSAAAPQGGGSGRLPGFIPPSLAALHDAAPSGADWIHEIKFDGYRIEARLDKGLDRGKVKLLTRKALDWTHRFKRIADALAALPAETALLDGELVVENEKGVSSFSMLQTDLKAGRGDRFVYWVFDLLHLDGRDLTDKPLIERKAALRRLLRGKSRAGPIRYAEHFDGDGPLIFKHACELNLEGIVSKRRDAPYRSGRSENFVKTKCHNAQEFVVTGFSPSTAMPKAVGALTVAFHEDGKLRYAGRVGTGYSRETARDLWKRLQPLRIDRPPITLPKNERRKDVIWVKPRLVVETEFRGVTHDGLLRQASYKGLREDKPAREVVREVAGPAPANSAQLAQRQAVRKSAAPKRKPPRANMNSEIANVHLTHPDRVYWADVGVTKEDLAEYYVSVWAFMAPHVVDRPLAVVRGPGGTSGELFFQKHIASNIKGSSLRHVVNAKEHDVIAVEKLGDLIALVQSGALEIHTRGSRLGRLEICDRIVFDLDPGEGVSWHEIVAAAQETRDRLKAEKLKSFVKLSGGKGIHVVVPIDGAGWDATKAFTARIANAMAADAPRRYLAKMTKALRQDKIFIDYLRNTREATSVAAYSTRARAGAPVSMPVSWEALTRSTGANQFTVLNLKKRLKDDAWAGIGKVRQKLPETAKRRG